MSKPGITKIWPEGIHMGLEFGGRSVVAALIAVAPRAAAYLGTGSGCVENPMGQMSQPCKLDWDHIPSLFDRLAL